MSNPIDEFLNHGKEKTAGFANFWSKIPTIGQAAILGVAGTAGTIALNEGYAAVKGAIQKSQGFKGMMKYAPQLAKEDRSKVQAIYNTLNTVSPDLSVDPIIASSWVTRMLHQDQYVDPKTVADLAAAQANIAKAESMRAVDFGKTPQWMGMGNTANAFKSPAQIQAEELPPPGDTSAPYRQYMRDPGMHKPLISDELYREAARQNK
jgi:hypothetical protein